MTSQKDTKEFYAEMHKAADKLYEIMTMGDFRKLSPEEQEKRKQKFSEFNNILDEANASVGMQTVKF